MFVTRMRDVYVVGCLGNACSVLQRIRLANNTDWLANGLPITRTPGIIRFQRNLVCSRKLRFQGRSHVKVPQFCTINMTDGRHNENRFRLYLGLQVTGPKGHWSET